MRSSRSWTLLLLLYVGLDFLDPSIPGVFFLDNDKLFVDGVAASKSASASTLAPAPSPSPSTRLEPSSDRVSSPRMPTDSAPRGLSRQSLARRSLWPSGSPAAAEDH
jgi:hypothetical protein